MFVGRRPELAALDAVLARAGTAQTLTARPELAGEGANTHAELAHHWHAAGELPAALASSVRAAAQADRMRAHPEAIAHLQRALELWEQVPDAAAVAGTDHMTLLLRASEMAEHAGDDELGLELAKSARREVDVSRILTKLGVSNRGEAAAAAHRAGLAGRT